MRLILFALVVILMNCGSQSNTFDYSKTKQYAVPESNIAFVIPKEYSKITIDDYKDLMYSSDFSDEVISSQINTLSNIENKFHKFDLLVDTTTLENLIWIIRSGPYIELDRQMLNMAVEMYSQTNSFDSLIINKEELIEKQLIYMDGFNYIKLKMEQDYIKGTRLVSHYLISTDDKTLGISFLSTENKDYQEYVNRTISLK